MFQFVLGAAMATALTSGGAAPAAAQSAIPQACRAEVEARLPGWRLKPPPVDLALWLEARGRTASTNVASADFDLDGTGDTALLVTAPRRGHRLPYVVVCLHREAEPRVFVIRDPYGQDGIGIRPKGTVGYDHLTERKVRYWTNAIQTYAFEKAGGSYLFRDGRFVLIVDSD